MSDDVSSSYSKPLKLWKINIGSEENPKMASIETIGMNRPVTEIQALLWEYEDLFPKIFSELKGIKGYLGEMKIELNRTQNQSNIGPICLNPRFKEKVKKEIDRMLAVGLIFPVDEVEWIIPIVI
jgi:hypothetical protein